MVIIAFYFLIMPKGNRFLALWPLAALDIDSISN